MIASNSMRAANFYLCNRSFYSEGNKIGDIGVREIATGG